MLICPSSSCRAENLEGAASCRQCATEFEAQTVNVGGRRVALICPFCREENPEQAAFCRNCDAQFPSAIPQNAGDNPTVPEMLDKLSDSVWGNPPSRVRGIRWGRLSGVALVALVLASGGGFLLARTQTAGAFDMQNQARLVAEAMNPVHSRGCTIQIATGATSDQSPAELEKKARASVGQAKARGAEAAAFVIEEATEGTAVMVNRADGSQKKPTYIGTLIAVLCER